MLGNVPPPRASSQPSPVSRWRRAPGAPRPAAAYLAHRSEDGTLTRNPPHGPASDPRRPHRGRGAGPHRVGRRQARSKGPLAATGGRRKARQAAAVTWADVEFRERRIGTAHRHPLEDRSGRRGGRPVPRQVCRESATAHPGHGPGRPRVRAPLGLAVPWLAASPPSRSQAVGLPPGCPPRSLRTRRARRPWGRRPVLRGFERPPLERDLWTL